MFNEQKESGELKSQEKKRSKSRFSKGTESSFKLVQKEILLFLL
jgi:hypothetical protein